MSGRRARYVPDRWVVTPTTEAFRADYPADRWTVLAAGSAELDEVCGKAACIEGGVFATQAEAMDAAVEGWMAELVEASRGGVCAACGSTAAGTRVRRDEAGVWWVLDLCRAHEAVCWEHLADPCPVCEVAE